jgi:hypothetical protein
MSKRPSSDQPTTVKRARKVSGFRLARSRVIDPVPSTISRFFTLSENPRGRGNLRLLHRTSEPSSPSKSQSNDAEPQVSDPTLGLQEAAPHEEVRPDTSHAEHTQEKRKRERHTKTYVSSVSIFLHV